MSIHVTTAQYRKLEDLYRRFNPEDYQDLVESVEIDDTGVFANDNVTFQAYHQDGTPGIFIVIEPDGSSRS